MTRLAIDKLCVTLAGRPVLKNIDLAVPAGETLGLVGESGSGKSMTLLAIMGLLPAGARATGSIRLSGEELTSLSETALCSRRGRDIGMVFQEPMSALNPVRTIGDQVAEAVALHRGLPRDEALRIAREALDRVELPEPRFPLSLYPHELSGGQRQRVAIAIAIALKPQLLLADEPTTALDVVTQAQLLALFRRLVQEDGLSLILVSHDLAVVSALADRLAIMRAGEIVERVDRRPLLRGLQHPYARSLLEAAQPRAEPRAPVHVSASPILAVEGASCDYWLARPRLGAPRPRLRAVDRVSFRVAPGETVALVGESGCGKSTLARAILGLEPLSEGTIVLAGAPQGNGPARLRRDHRQAQLVFQDPFGSFNPRHRIERIVAEPLHLIETPLSRVERRHRVETMLTRVGLAPEDADRYPHAFSGGQRQRIAIARALIVEPALVVLDEAVSALDVSLRAQILALLASLSRGLGVAYLFISHDLLLVGAIADRVLVMQAGRIVEEGTPEAVLRSPRHPYTAALVRATPRVEAPVFEGVKLPS